MKKYVRWSTITFVLSLSIGPILFQNCARIDVSSSKRFLTSVSDNNGAAVCTDPASAVYHEGDVTISGPSSGYPGDSQQFTVTMINPCLEFSTVVWQAGDGTAKEQSVPPLIYNHIYQNPGHYVVSAYLVDGSSTPVRLDSVIDIVDKCPTSGPCQLNVNQYTLHGPSIAVVGENLKFDIVPQVSEPAMVESWNFGDAAAIASSNSTMNHSYSSPGIYNIQTNIRTASPSETRILTHQLTVVSAAVSTAAACDLSAITVTGQTRLAVNQSGQYYFYLKDCKLPAAIRWYIDGDEVVGNGQFLEKAWPQQGLYNVEARVFENIGDASPAFASALVVWVTDNVAVVGSPEPVNPLTCGNMTEGQRVILDGELTSRSVACGNNGVKTQYYRGQNEFICQAGSLVLVNQTGTLISETPCTGQNCSFQGKTFKAGESDTYYSASAPEGLCSSVSQVRVCQGDTGTMTGAVQFSLLTCRSGCGSFGLDGTEKDIISPNNLQEAKVCAHGETGIFNVFQQNIHQKCSNGTINNSAPTKGALLTAGVCPQYAWVATGWGSCSADCGGSQQATYSCRSNGVQVPVGQESRCGLQPKASKVCDGNPAASQSSTTFENANSTTKCPANKIGLIEREREVTTTLTCQSHAMTSTVTKGPWNENTYCRDIVPYRCSQDSLTPSQAYGRLRWMQKCAEQVPTIQEFFTRTASAAFAPQNVFANSVKDLGDGQVSFGRLTYGTFLKADGSAWVAPAPGTRNYAVRNAAENLDLSAYSCEVPSGVYLASVCTSSCATPTQRVLTDIQHNQYETFISALSNKRQALTTLTEDSVSGLMSYQQTKVQSFVTELVDGQHEILIFKMLSGGKVELTPNHPILTEEGTMRTAAEWKVGDSLVQVSGLLDKVVSITKVIHTGKVYNVFMANDNAMNNVIVTEGYLNGSAFFQNQGIDLLNRQIIRTRFTNGVK